MKALKIIGIIVLVLAVVLGVGGMLLPRYTTLSRSRSIVASPDKIAGQINELHNWNNWSPWHQLDPNMHIEYSSPSAGPGAWYTWKGNDKVGEGKLTLTGVTPDSISTEMDFGMGTPAHAAFRFQPEGEATKVTWMFYGDCGANPYMHWMGLMMDNFVGKDYEKGLDNLAKATEGK